MTQIDFVCKWDHYGSSGNWSGTVQHSCITVQGYTIYVVTITTMFHYHNNNVPLPLVAVCMIYLCLFYDQFNDYCSLHSTFSIMQNYQSILVSRRASMLSKHARYLYHQKLNERCMLKCVTPQNPFQRLFERTFTLSENFIHSNQKFWDRLSTQGVHN